MIWWYAAALGTEPSPSPSPSPSPHRPPPSIIVLNPKRRRTPPPTPSYTSASNQPPSPSPLPRRWFSPPRPQPSSPTTPEPPRTIVRSHLRRRSPTSAEKKEKESTTPAAPTIERPVRQRKRLVAVIKRDNTNYQGIPYIKGLWYSTERYSQCCIQVIKEEGER
ncbi:hypothetical protein HanPI659440_Chr14g0561941 [Helianthus annuus]|nr:hypothetical protein HanPI659440_Chr14g0561941 [Helianthus annuus]